MKTTILVLLLCILTPILAAGHSTIDSSGTFTDTRDGQVYKWVKIGTQIWMAENLKFRADSGAVCQDNNLVNCDVYGLLYTWGVAKEVCPEGWSLPSDQQWGRLENYLGMDTSEILDPGRRGIDQGYGLKSRFGWYFSGNGSDKYGFKALPAGYLKGTMAHYFKSAAFFWTSTPTGRKRLVPKAWTRSLHFDDNKIGRYAYSQDRYLSVRCIKDH